MSSSQMPVEDVQPASNASTPKNTAPLENNSVSERAAPADVVTPKDTATPPEKITSVEGVPTVENALPAVDVTPTEKVPPAGSDLTADINSTVKDNIPGKNASLVENPPSVETIPHTENTPLAKKTSFAEGSPFVAGVPTPSKLPEDGHPTPSVLLNAPPSLLQELESSAKAIDWDAVESDPDSPPHDPYAPTTNKLSTESRPNVDQRPSHVSRFNSIPTTIEEELQRRVAEVNQGLVPKSENKSSSIGQSRQFSPSKPKSGSPGPSAPVSKPRSPHQKHWEKKKDKPPTQKIMCTICNVPVSSERALQAHENGKNHKTRLRQKAINEKMKPPSRLSFKINRPSKRINDDPSPPISSPGRNTPSEHPVRSARPSISSSFGALDSSLSSPSPGIHGRNQIPSRFDQPVRRIVEQSPNTTVPGPFGLEERGFSGALVGNNGVAKNIPFDSVGLKRKHSAESPVVGLSMSNGSRLDEDEHATAQQRNLMMDEEPVRARRKLNEDPSRHNMAVGERGEGESSSMRPLNNERSSPAGFAEQISQASNIPLVVSKDEQIAREDAAFNNPLFPALVNDMERMALVSDSTIFPNGKRVPQSWLAEPVTLQDLRDLRSLVLNQGTDADRLAFKMLQEIILSPLLGIRSNLLKPLSNAVSQAAGQYAVHESGVFVRLSKILQFKAGPDPRYRDGDEEWIKEQTPEMLAMCALMENLRFMFSPCENGESVPHSKLDSFPLRGSFGVRMDAHASYAQMKGRTPRYDDSVGNDALFREILASLLDRTLTMNATM